MDEKVKKLWEEYKRKYEENKDNLPNYSEESIRNIDQIQKYIINPLSVYLQYTPALFDIGKDIIF